jgi:hypothetical protein
MIPLAMAAIQTGIGLSQVAAGANKQSRALRDREVAIGDLEDTRYADYNQAYYNELQRRESVGLPEAQRQYMEQQAERAAGVGLAATEDRRAGIMGIGRAQAGLAQSYTNIGMADVAAREQNAQRVLGEMGQRGMQTYQEQMQLGQLDLSLAEQARQEGLSQQQAGLQSTMTGLGQIGTLKGGGNQTQDLYGQGTTQASVNPLDQGVTVNSMGANRPYIDPSQYDGQMPSRFGTGISGLGSVYDGTPTGMEAPSYWTGQY